MTDRQTDGRTYGRTDRRPDGRTDRGTDNGAKNNMSPHFMGVHVTVTHNGSIIINYFVKKCKYYMNCFIRAKIINE